MYIREDIPSEELKGSYSSGNIESIFVEINLHKKKWINGGTFNPKKNSLAFHFNELKKCLMQLMLNYDNFVLLDDFNSEPNEPLIQEFLDSFGMKILVKETTCYKNLQNPTCIDLILTNRQTMHVPKHKNS